MKYEPLDRDHELQFRAECPEYAAERAAEARAWRELRRDHGPAKARRVWWNMRRAMRLTVDMIADNMMCDTPQQSALSRSWEEFWRAD